MILAFKKITLVYNKRAARFILFWKLSVGLKFLSPSFTNFYNLIDFQLKNKHMLAISTDFDLPNFQVSPNFPICTLFHPARLLDRLEYFLIWISY